MMKAHVLLLLLCLFPSFLLSTATCFTSVPSMVSTMKHPAVNSDIDVENGEISIKSFTVQDPEIDSCYAIRNAVFIQEQNVPVEIEMDSYDGTAIHILAYCNGEVCGAARLIISEDEAPGTQVGKIGRVCVLASHRRRGIGRKVMEFAVEELRRSLRSGGKARLGAQTHALAFYESVGFRLIPGDNYMAAGGVPHRDMEMVL
jgi:predicted GNAT family N-acyltransferase